MASDSGDHRPTATNLARMARSTKEDIFTMINNRPRKEYAYVILGYGKSYVINYPGYFIESFGEQFTLNHLKYPAPVQGKSFCVPWQSTMHHVLSLKDDFYLGY